jgi:pilus assembly protein CpaE
VTVSVQAVVAVDDEFDRGLIDAVMAGQEGVTVLDYLDVGGPTASTYGAGDVFIVACVDYTADAQAYVQEAAKQHPSRPIVLVCPAGNNGYLRQAFESGVEDVVALPPGIDTNKDTEFADHLAFALQKAVVRRRGEDVTRPKGDGRLICVLGLKGGSGKTLTTANLGAALAAAGSSVAILDLDLQFGDLALTMGLAPDRTIYDLVRSGGSLDAEKLRDFLAVHSSGAQALLAPLRPDHASVVNPPFVREVLRLLRDMFDYVIVDTPPNFTPEVICAVDMADDILMVAMRDTLSLKNTKLGLETLERMDYDRRKIRILLNRANTKVGIARQDVLGILGRDVDVLVPSHRHVTRSVNQGMPIALEKGSAAGKAFRQLAAMYQQDAASATAKAKPRPVTVPDVEFVAKEAGSAQNGDAEKGSKPRGRLFKRGR